jgi:hypothetical protein
VEPLPGVLACEAAAHWSNIRNMDRDPEIIRRLGLLDRKLNYFIGVVICAVALSVGAGVYYFARSSLGDLLAIVAGIIVAGIVGKTLEFPFRRADP